MRAMRDPVYARVKPLLERVLAKRGFLKAYTLFVAFEDKDLQHVCVAAFCELDAADIAIPIELAGTYEDH